MIIELICLNHEKKLNNEIVNKSPKRFIEYEKHLIKKKFTFFYRTLFLIILAFFQLVFIGVACTYFQFLRKRNLQFNNLQLVSIIIHAYMC